MYNLYPGPFLSRAGKKEKGPGYEAIIIVQTVHGYSTYNISYSLLDLHFFNVSDLCNNICFQLGIVLQWKL